MQISTMLTFPEAISLLVPGYTAVPAPAPAPAPAPPHSKFGISCAADEPTLPRISKEKLMQNSSMRHENLAGRDSVYAKIINGKLMAFCRTLARLQPGEHRWTLVNLGVVGVCSYNAGVGCIDDQARSLAWPPGFRPICVIGENLGDAIVVGRVHNDAYISMCRISEWRHGQPAPKVVATSVPYADNTTWNAAGEAQPVDLETLLGQAYCPFATVLVLL